VKRALLLIALASCMPDMNDDEAAIEIDLQQCHTESVSKYLPLGSVWIDVNPVSPYLCELTLGGETENPSYDGRAAQRCLFYRLGSISIDLGSGGPAYIDSSSNCADL
jgi:hypothetical protein